VPNGPVLDVLTLLDHPWVDERRLLRPVPAPDGSTVQVSRQPVVYGSAPPSVEPATPPPELGQHTEAKVHRALRGCMAHFERGRGEFWEVSQA